MALRSRPRTSLALCAGFLGLERGVELAGAGVRLVGVVERQAYAAAIIASRMEEGAVDSCPVHDSLESFDCESYRGRVDICVAGFPCQGASVAGKRLGVEDERWLWPEVWRIARAVEARWLFVENVTGLLSVNGGAAFEEILRDLGESGWSARWDCVPAGAIGAPHLRDRVFLLAADTNRVGVRVEPERNQRQGGGSRASERGDGEPHDESTEGHAADSNNTSEQPPKRSRRARKERPRRDTIAGDTAPADADSSGCNEGRPGGPRTLREGRTDVARGDQPDARPRHATDTTGERCEEADAKYDGPGALRQLADGDAEPTPKTRDPADSDDAGRASERRSGELDEAFGSTRGSDVDRRRGPWPRHLDESIDRIDEGRAHWGWGRAPLATFRKLDDGPTNWVDGDLDADDDESSEVLPGVLRAPRAKAVREFVGGQVSLFETATLRSVVHGESDGPGGRQDNALGASDPGTKAPRARMQQMRIDHGPFDPSRESGVDGPPPAEFDDALLVLSHDLASRGWRHQSGEAVRAMSRLLSTLAEERSLRVSRSADEEAWRSASDDEKHRWLMEARERCESSWLHATSQEELHLLGNGCVPQAAAFAFTILWERLHGTALAIRGEGSR